MPPYHPTETAGDHSTGLPRVLRLGVLVLFGLLVACETIPVSPPSLPPRTEPASAESAAQAETAGEYVVAAREYERLAEDATPPEKQRYLLQSMEALLKGGQYGQVRARLAAIDLRGLDPALLARKHVLEARLAVVEGEHQTALKRLDEAAKLRNLSPALLSEIHEARAQAELALGNPFGAVRELIVREQYVAGAETVAENQTRLWRILEQAPREQIRSERYLASDAVLAGWLDLALAAHDHVGNTVALGQALNEWRRLYPAHPAGAALLETLTAGAPALVGRIERIALLLPITSDYRIAAEAVRDGFLAMHAAAPESGRPKVTIYDLGPDPALAPQVYERAVREGAQIVVGPLGREATDAVIRASGLAVPTLLLSHTEEHPPGPARLYQFGLPPEQEARQAAERAYLDGCRHAAVLYPEGAWGERMMNAFMTHWQRLGALAVASQSYAERNGDYSEPVKRLLNIPESEARKSAVEKKLGQRLQFDPRPRQDVECIFLAADARHGRLIKPQLNYFRAGGLPVYATSHIYTGKADPVHDVDLDGVQFGDMPWMLAQAGRIAELRNRLQGDWPHVHTDLDRLYALGMDSYAILPHLERISAEHAARFAGVTSGLSLDRDGRLHRQLSWARFRSGVPRLIDRP